MKGVLVKRLNLHILELCGNSYIFNVGQFLLPTFIKYKTILRTSEYTVVKKRHL